jgi:hypothetical protein
MTRRGFCLLTPVGQFLSLAAASSVIVPIRHVIDQRANLSERLTRPFWSTIWPEAVRDFQKCGVRLESTVTQGEIRRSPAGRPVFVGLASHILNVVITDQIPMDWGGGRGLGGVTTRYEGFHICMIALNYAHAHKIPLVAVNTCVHELLHALLQDIYESRPKGVSGEAREFRIDWYATHLWLFGQGRAIRDSAVGYLRRLQSGTIGGC